MADENNPADQKPDAEQSDPSGAKNGIIESKLGAFQQPDSEHTGDAAHDPPKQTIVVRLWHSLWRKRVFFRHHHGGGPNWAEKTSMYITAGILAATSIQALIYWKQAGIMQSSLNQNERSIILGQGQLIVAARNAKTAEDTLGEVQEGGNDTHELAVQAKNQADRAKEIADRTLAQATATNKLARNAEQTLLNTKKSLRPWVNAQKVFPTVDVQEGHVPIHVIVENGGNSPALHTITYMETNTFCGGNERTRFPENPPYHPNMSWPSTAMMMPGTGAEVVPGTYSYEIDHVKWIELKADSCSLYAYGVVSYCDVFGRFHWQFYCGKWMPNTARQFNTCYNYSDGDQDFPNLPELSCPRTPNDLPPEVTRNPTKAKKH